MLRKLKKYLFISDFFISMYYLFLNNKFKYVYLNLFSSSMVSD